MRIVVLSDSHGDLYGLHTAIDRQSSAEIVVFLGDGLREAENLPFVFPNKQFFMVKGNCDLGFNAPAFAEFTAAGKKIYITHGYAEQVKYGTENLLARGSESKAGLVLYGHTHKQKIDYENGIYLFNPGAVRQGEYGVVDITKAGIVCIGMKL